jgi:DNA-binding transcriptional regulator YhcF (GntR family)
MIQSGEDFNVSKYSYNDDSSFSFITSYRELADLYSCNSKNISKSIRALEKLGFIKAQNIYIRKKYGDNDDCRVQERQDQSLWKITLSLPDECISELEKVKNRSNLKLKYVKNELAAIENNVAPKLIEDCLILGGIKFNLNLDQSRVLKSIIVDDDDCSTAVNCDGNIKAISPLPHAAPCNESYINSVMGELDIETTWKVEDKLEESSRRDDSEFLSDEPETLSTSSSLEELDKKIEKNDGIKSVPHVAKSGLLLNKDLISKIKDIKSNLGATPEVLFNNFLKRFSKNESDKNADSKKHGIAKDREFNIHSELIRENLKYYRKTKLIKLEDLLTLLFQRG